MCSGIIDVLSALNSLRCFLAAVALWIKAGTCLIKNKKSLFASSLFASTLNPRRGEDGV